MTGTIHERTKIFGAPAPLRPTRPFNGAAVSLVALLVCAAMLTSCGSDALGGDETPRESVLDDSDNAAEATAAAGELTSAFENGRIEMTQVTDSFGAVYEIGVVGVFSGDDAEISYESDFPADSMIGELSMSTTTRYVDGRIYGQGDYQDAIDIDLGPQRGDPDVWTDFGPAEELEWTSWIATAMNGYTQTIASYLSDPTAMIDMMVTAEDFEQDGDNVYRATLKTEQVATLVASPGANLLFGGKTSKDSNGTETNTETNGIEEASVELTTSGDGATESIAIHYVDRSNDEVDISVRLDQLGKVDPIEVPDKALEWTAGESNYAKAKKAGWESRRLLDALDVCRDLDETETLLCLTEAGETEAAEALQAKITADELVTDEEMEKYEFWY